MHMLGCVWWSLNECSPQIRIVYGALMSRIFTNAFPLSMPSRKRKHGYEDDDHVVKRQMVTEEVSFHLFFRCAQNHLLAIGISFYILQEWTDEDLDAL